jgi:hypothetical protein
MVMDVDWCLLFVSTARPRRVLARPRIDLADTSQGLAETWQGLPEASRGLTIHPAVARPVSRGRVEGCDRTRTRVVPETTFFVLRLHKSFPLLKIQQPAHNVVTNESLDCRVRVLPAATLRVGGERGRREID